MLVLKKRNILVVLAIIVISVIFGITLTGLYGEIASGKVFTLVIDAGHGGVDGGVIGVKTKTKESDINLSISKKLENISRKANFETIMTRKTADGLYGLATRGFKARDMAKRKEIINNAGADFVISIHQNKYSKSSRRGTQVFYSKNGNKLTKNMAESMQNYINKELNVPTLNKSFAAQEGDFFIVKCSKIPTIIIECGFLSNEEDEKLLIDENYQNKLANVIFSGLMSFINEIYSQKLIDINKDIVSAI